MSNTPETPKTDRDEQGRFKVGNGGGPGNPFARKVAGFRAAFMEKITNEDVQKVVGVLLTMCLDGNLQAIKLFLAYSLGKPDKVLEPDRMDAHEWEVQKETAGMMQEMATVTQAPDPIVPLKAARVLRPLVGSIVEQQICDSIMNPPPEEEVPELVRGKGYVPPPTPNGLFEAIGLGKGGGNGQPTAAEAAWLARLAKEMPSTNGKK